jgi:hypothetical protein
LLYFSFFVIPILHQRRAQLSDSNSRNNNDNDNINTSSSNYSCCHRQNNKSGEQVWLDLAGRVARKEQESGTDVMILKIFPLKNLAKIWHFSLKLLLVFAKT